MEFLNIFIIIVVFTVLYSINIYLPKKKYLKYVISLIFFFVGVVGWVYVWFGSGWLITGIISTLFLVLSLLSFVFTIGLDLYTYAKSKRIK
ncbi:hypothetical protein ACFFF5_13485 [Lederbergia wuyishanensis]|uniref:Glucan phosphoethanolaminetransferase (Alkaline phosphatase superfamily) n=1 Tax=Lederbergia wuyishanensis TaxID=1347903 RepID=A0ABU0D537_9BACI|nr:hypothetical protein [Lederbergia wuyishanensis]MCJ8009575.1 hypothetical protein [Lederbergia wuyishanensis]MDQ0343481.1 glucan phosphoethanolaminetransferase (alkaline phosphatase superfamily) [Lederbergia wuyishanensis]